MSEIVPSINRLLYRRGYLLGSEKFEPTEYWHSVELNHDLFLSTHADLNIAIARQNASCIVLIGTAIDALFPERTTEEISQEIVNHSKNIHDVIDQSYSLAGRWLIIFQVSKGTFLFTDPCGFRQVFYNTSSDSTWCGSQPEILKSVHPLHWRKDEEVLKFLSSKNHYRNESVWIGNQTVYDGCFHLIPNHYLDLNQAKPIRFYPNKPLPVMDTDSIVRSASSILRGIYRGVVGQHKVIQALTAGWDSRILLAASKEYSSDIQYYVDRQGIHPKRRPDIWVPKMLSRKLDLNFRVDNSKENPPGWFISLLSQNVTGARILPKTRPIFANLINNETRINLNGNGSEICRNWYDQYSLNNNYEIDDTLLPGIHGFIDNQYVRGIINEWKEDLYSFGLIDRNILDMLYWEQRLGNWGALYPAERDIALEEFSPFNCRILIDTLFSSQRHLRSAPKYKLFKMLIQEMWPETLAIPINPFSKRPGNRLWKIKLRKIVPSSIKNPFRKT